MDYKKHILCFIKENKAFFTNKPLAEQWGDDWGDTPYESNAGEPYDENPGDIYAVYVESGDSCGDIQTPKDDFSDYFNVEEINSGKIPWMTFKTYGDEGISKIDIFAGTTYEEFENIILQHGGKIYYPMASLT